MAILTFPAIQGAEVDWWLRRRTQSFVSPLTGSAQTAELPGAMWAAAVTFPPLSEARWRELSAFLTSLRGRVGRFFFAPPHARAPAVMPPYTAPVVSGGGQAGAVLAVAGFAASQTIFRAGDYVAFDTPSGRRELKMVVADAVSSGSGTASLAIEPAIREAPAGGTVLRFGQPGYPLGCVMQLTDDSAARVSVGLGRIGQMAVEMEEALI